MLDRDGGGVDENLLGTGLGGSGHGASRVVRSCAGVNAPMRGVFPRFA
jgi:hypothetical protein